MGVHGIIMGGKGYNSVNRSAPTAKERLFFLYTLRRCLRTVSAFADLCANGILHTGKVLRGRAVAFFLVGFLGLLLYSRYTTALNFFVVHDNGKMTVHQTYTSDARLALEEAGITIGKSDYVSLPEPMNGGAAEVYIERSQTVTLKLDGRESVINMLGGTVSTALTLADYVPDVRDVIVPSLDTQLYDGMVITVTRVSAETIQVFEEIPFETLRQSNSRINKGTEVVSQQGEPGQFVRTYESIKENGVEVERRLILEAVVVEPKPEIIQYGTGGTVTLSSGEVIGYTRKLECIATAYTTEGRSQKRNALGKVARVGTIAVDPKVIPLRSKVYVTSANGKWVYGAAVCEDTGGVIKGNKVDLFFDTTAECIKFGVRKCWVYILE